MMTTTMMNPNQVRLHHRRRRHQEMDSWTFQESIGPRKTQTWVLGGRTRDTTRTEYSAPPVQKATPPATKSYHETVAEWQVHHTPQQIPRLVPPLFAQKAWHERDMSRPMLEPSTGPIPIDTEYQGAFHLAEGVLGKCPSL